MHGVTRLRLAFVSSFPPGRRPLSEYAWHLIQSLARHPHVEHVSVLADRHAGIDDEAREGIDVIRCWSFGGIDLPFSAVRTAKRLRVDAIWFNLHLTSAGNSRLSRFAGLAAPALARSADLLTVVTLHNMLGLTDVQQSGLHATRLDLLAADLATRLVGRAHLVCTPLPEYAELLRSKYRIPHARFIPHGTLGAPLAAVPTSAGRQILAFGHFGSYKQLEDVIEGVGDLVAEGNDLELCIAGIDSRHNPGYLARLQERYRGATHVRFVGYVPEDDVPALFQSAVISILPYATVTGMSGVAIQSAMNGVPMVTSDIPGFRALERQGMRLNMFQWGNRGSLMAALRRALSSSALRRKDAQENLAYCHRQLMSAVVDQYVNLIEAAVATRRPVLSAPLLQDPALEARSK